MEAEATVSNSKTTPEALRGHADNLSPSGNYWVSGVLKQAADEMERLLEVRRAAREFVQFVLNNVPNLEPHEVGAVFGHLEWDELRAALKETQ